MASNGFKKLMLGMEELGHELNQGDEYFDLLYSYIDEEDLHDSSNSINEASENIQYGVHQFSADSIIFRGSEEECGEYINERPELWDDAEIYKMTPDDPHYQKNEAYRSGDRYYGGLPSEPSASEYGRAMNSANAYQQSLLDKYGIEVEKTSDHTIYKGNINGHQFTLIENIDGLNHYVSEFILDGLEVDIYKSPARPGSIRNMFEVNASSIAAVIDFIEKDALDELVYRNNNSLEEAMKSYPHDYDKIELEYKNLDIVLCGPQIDVDSWDEWDLSVNWIYEVDKNDLYEFIFESCLDDEEFSRRFDDDFDPNNESNWNEFIKWLEDNFDTIFTKYENDILDNWEEDAREDAEENYDPDDYIDWDSMPGGHDDYRFDESLYSSDKEYVAKECSYEMAEEIAQKAKKALKLPSHEVEMLEHDINNLRSNEWVDTFAKLSDRSEVKKLFFTYAVEEEMLDEAVENDSEKICCICNEPYEGYGNNAEPVCSGRCCDKCNIERVIPMRFKIIKNESKELNEGTIHMSKAQMAKLDKDVEDAQREVGKYKIRMKSQKNSDGSVVNVPDFGEVPENELDAAKKAYANYVKAVEARPDRAKNEIVYDESLTEEKNSEKLFRKFPELRKSVNEEVEEVITENLSDGTYTVTYYESTATRERRPETAEDVKNDWKVETFNADSDFDALKHALAIMYMTSDEYVEDDCDVYDEECAITYLEEADWGDGSPIIIKLEGPDGVIYDTGYTHNDFIKQQEESENYTKDRIKEMEETDPDAAEQWKRIFGFTEDFDPECADCDESLLGTLAASAIGSYVGRKLSEDNDIDDDYNFDDMDEMLTEDTEIKRLRHIYGVE